MNYDVIVLGSGSAGLMAALTAATNGRRTLLLEKTDKLGGMTAYSGAGIWIPANHHAAEAGIADSQSDALAYIRAASPRGWADTEDELWQAFVRYAPEALTHLEHNTPLQFGLVAGPDVFLDKPGAKAHGRMVSPNLISRYRLGQLSSQLRSAVLPQLMTYGESQRTDPLTLSMLQALSWAPRFAGRLAFGYRGMGSALVIGLLRGLQLAGVDIQTGAHDVNILEKDGRVSGVSCRIAGLLQRYDATCGVIIATGGFEWDDDLRQTFFPGPIDYLTSPRSNNGDAVRFAKKIGAALAHMDQANMNAAIPGRYEGKVQGIGWFLHHFPGAIVVDSTGERIGDETDPNFFALLNARHENGALRHSPAWLIADAAMLRKHRLARMISRVDPSWMRGADCLEELATQLGLPTLPLLKTVQRFNADAVTGRDSLFGRKEVSPLTRAPFVAIPFNRSFMSTKGGPRTDAEARVLRPDGSPIQGLFCAGTAMANPIGSRAISSGTTLGPNLTWGYIAGLSVSI